MAEEKEKNIQFHNKLSPNFREIHVDGAYGGITPRGYINLNFYAERFPIPKSTTYNLQENKLAEKITEECKAGIIREYEFGVYLDFNTATDIYNFLGQKIKELETKRDENDTNIR